MLFFYYNIGKGVILVFSICNYFGYVLWLFFFLGRVSVVCNESEVERIFFFIVFLYSESRF